MIALPRREHALGNVVVCVRQVAKCVVLTLPDGTLLEIGVDQIVGQEVALVLAVSNGCTFVGDESSGALAVR